MTIFSNCIKLLTFVVKDVGSYFLFVLNFGGAIGSAEVIWLRRRSRRNQITITPTKDPRIIL